MKIAKIYFEGNLVTEVEHDTIKKCLDSNLNYKWFNLYLKEKEVALFGLGYSFIVLEKNPVTFEVKGRDLMSAFHQPFL
jgi:hypothetical protein